MLRHHRLRIPVVPQGGLTGLVDRAVLENGIEPILSLDRTKAIRTVSSMDFNLVVEGGCILEDAKNAAKRVGCLLPKGSAPRATAGLPG